MDIHTKERGTAVKEIIIATNNPGKAKEFVTLFPDYEVKTLLDFPDAPDIEETGETFEENALLKAKGISEYFGKTVIADDSGLVIDALDGRPGVYSARYAGEHKNDADNIKKVLEELQNVPSEKRTARFQCTLCLVSEGRNPIFFNGTCEGTILTEPRGTNGFGYDPIFYVPELGKTMAELTSEEKNKISHRGNAIRKLAEWVSNHGL